MKWLIITLSAALTLHSVSANDALEAHLLDEFMSYDLYCNAPIPNVTSTHQGYKTLKRLQYATLANQKLPLEMGNSSVQGGGLLLFTQHPLQGYVLGGGSSVLALYSTNDLQQVAIIHMVTSEGPGPLEITLVNTRNAQPHITCTTLNTPKELNAGGWKMEYSLPVYFNINELGKGILYSRADIDDAQGQPQTLWFAYYTQDAGQTWSEPEHLAQPPTSTPEGIYQVAKLHH